MTSIPILDLTTQYESIRAEVEAATLKVLASGRYIKGPSVETFEQALANYVATSHCIACNSGTDALFLALRALDIGPGDEVITTPFTFIATAEVISAVGATPVFVDIDPDTFNLDLKQIPGAITDRTRAIMPVHLFGRPVDMTEVMAIAQTYQLWVIEDCAQAIGATWQGQKVGRIGHIGCFSFYPTKNLGACGDGGAVTTNDDAIAHKIRVLADHGRTGGYYHEAVGVNSRLDAIQAEILTIKLQHLDQWNAQRRQRADYYSQHLRNLDNLHLPTAPNNGESVWNQYTIRITDEAALSIDAPASNRDRVRSQLQQDGISTMIYYPLPLHQQPIYLKRSPNPKPLPTAEAIAHQVMSLPMFPELTSWQQDQVIQSLLKISHSECIP
ncbi:MAG: DegT/DnrJ/EryC1/StrS family aminotransferase [Leptolyngbyaceae cyanobacterium]